jgi:signal transduction histidine kinase
MCMELNTFFEVFKDGPRQRLMALSRRETFQHDERVFEEGALSDSVYLVLRGRVALVKRTSRNETGTVAHIEQGDYFGEMGVIDDCPRSTGAFAVGETILAKLPAAPFIEILRSEPGALALHFFRHISDHLRGKTTQYIEEVLRKERLHAVGEMARSIIHDFKSPMTSIHIGTELIQERAHDQQVDRACELMMRQVKRMLSMAEQLLDYSEGRPELRKEPVNLRDLIAELELLNADFVMKNNVTFSNAVASVVVEIDRLRFMRVLQNLVSNAVEAFGAQRGLITITTEMRDKHSVAILVRDNGPGIPESVRDRVFEPFVSEGKRKGTGLGLAIAQAIVTAHGGSISYDTEAGTGTIFTILLPAGAAP